MSEKLKYFSLLSITIKNPLNELLMKTLDENEDIEYLPYCIGNIRHNGVVSTSNRLIRPIELSSNEYKALLYAMAVANYGEKNNQDKEITEQTYIYLHKHDLGELLGLDKKNSINVAIDRIYKELSSRVAHFVIEEPTEENKKKVKKVHSVVPIIRELRWEDDAKNALQIRFTSEVLPYFTRLANGNFTTYQLKHLFALESVASMSLYSFFIKNEYKFNQQSSYEVELSLENLRTLIDISEAKYDRWVDFRRYVLDKIINEINEFTELHLEYETIKKGRPVVGVLFKVTNKTSPEPKSISPKNKSKIYLDVPFIENNLIKDLGAKFDVDMRAWYIFNDNENIQSFKKWFKVEGCLTDSQANAIVNDILFQMDFADSGVSMEDFKRSMKAKLKKDPAFVATHRARLNEIFGKEIV